MAPPQYWYRPELSQTADPVWGTKKPIPVKVPPKGTENRIAFLLWNEEPVHDTLEFLEEAARAVRDGNVDSLLMAASVSPPIF